MSKRDEDEIQVYSHCTGNRRSQLNIAIVTRRLNLMLMSYGSTEAILLDFIKDIKELHSYWRYRDGMIRRNRFSN